MSYFKQTKNQFTSRQYSGPIKAGLQRQIPADLLKQMLQIKLPQPGLDLQQERLKRTSAHLLQKALLNRRIDDLLQQRTARKIRTLRQEEQLILGQFTQRQLSSIRVP